MPSANELLNLDHSLDHESNTLVQEITNKFGTIAINKQKTIYFPSGLLGMAEQLYFCLAKPPSEKLQDFTLLQSLRENGPCFVTLPIAMQNSLIEASDLTAGCKILNIDTEQFMGMIIVSIQQHPVTKVANIVLNLRAPLLIDVEKRVGFQHVFHHNKYKVRHLLGTKNTIPVPANE